MERERAKLEKLMNGGFMNDLKKNRRAKSQDILLGTQIVKNEIKVRIAFYLNIHF